MRANAAIQHAITLGAALAASLLASCGERDGAPIDVRATIGEVGRLPGQFAYPRAIAAHPGGGTVYVIDKSARLQQIDTETGDVTAVWTTPRFDRGKPTGMTVGAHPTRPGEPALYVADTHEHRVLVYALPASDSSEPDLAFGAYGSEPGRFVYPTDVAVLHDEHGRAVRLYVSEYGGNDRVTAFDVSESGDITPAFAFGEPGAPDDPGVRFNRPQSLAIDTKRAELVVVDACNHRVGRFTLEGEPVAWTGADGSLEFPYGVTLFGGGTALVSEFGASRLTLLDLETGEVLRRIGAPGRAEGELATPWGVEAAGDDAYVLDSGNNRLLVFDAPGSPLRAGWAR